MLFLTILALFESPALRGKYKGSEYFIALLSAVLWAVNPIQTQAVTYIVQRMASMAAMFCTRQHILLYQSETGCFAFKPHIILSGMLPGLWVCVGIEGKCGTAADLPHPG